MTVIDGVYRLCVSSQRGLQSVFNLNAPESCLRAIVSNCLLYFFALSFFSATSIIIIVSGTRLCNRFDIIFTALYIYKDKTTVSKQRSNLFSSLLLKKYGSSLRNTQLRKRKVKAADCVIVTAEASGLPLRKTAYNYLRRKCEISGPLYKQLIPENRDDIERRTKSSSNVTSPPVNFSPKA